MASIKGISEDFPGAYSGQGRSWELKTKEAIELLPDKYGFQPKVVLSQGNTQRQTNDQRQRQRRRTEAGGR